MNEVLVIRGVIAELSKEQQARVWAEYGKLKAQATNPLFVIALTLLGAELAAEINA